jgi:valyl-tRNA synthetase
MWDAHGIIWPGRDINLEILRVEGYRKFCNKLWNATKFAISKFDADYVPLQSEKVGRPVSLSTPFVASWADSFIVRYSQPTGKESLAEKWIMHKLNEAATRVNESLKDRNFMKATDDMYSFWLYEVCDVYIVRASSMAVFSPVRPELIIGF